MTGSDGSCHKQRLLPKTDLGADVAEFGTRLAVGFAVSTVTRAGICHASSLLSNNESFPKLFEFT